ncbi:MAG: hypothetical protein QOI15_3174 [Pseudonocardiales bacterium]|nr:hypothetical protein [Pseudonocardiales bacterium]
MSLDIAWLSVFADVPADRFDAALAFWAQVTDCSVGTPSGGRGEFTPLLPHAGDRYLWLQRIDEGEGGWHPDLHVADPRRAADEAMSLGARELSAGDGLIALATPAGQPFCVVRERTDGGRQRPEPPQWAGGRSLADQLCLDIPAGRYDEEIEFWAALTGWRPTATDAPEFRRLNPPDALPVQFLLQRLGAQDAGGARAHLDMSADDRAAEVERHESLGARTEAVSEGWTTLHDPADRIYCVTAREPGQPHR